ncbi:F-box/kelch-repeat protein [Hibiscus syriacus]|uniref:F-box/kelch-repeat protein n=2 Tax=Hibiscus syriacus TaxID=106335 RepID=A0A6A2X1T5_HIBSY|nr:F-box/kelch-repeat protein [Hibiscus syriacus]
MSDHNPKEPNINTLSIDLTELILSSLPIPSLLRASSVCNLWRSLISSPSFTSPSLSSPWFFLFGLHNTSSRNNQSFAFDPLSNSWFLLPSLHDDSSSSSFLGSSGFLFTTTPKFSYTPLLKSSWRLTSSLKYSRVNPLLGVFHDGSSGVHRGFKFIVVGGVRFIGGLVDIEDRLAVEIYDPNHDSWELCPALPADFRSRNSSQSLSSDLLKGKFYVFGIYSGFVSSFDMRNHVWSEVQSLRPPGIIFSFMISCNDMLVLAGMCNAPRGPSFNIWRIDERTMELSEIYLMPQSLLYSLVDDEEDDKFASLKCVGMSNLIYVFNEEYHQKYHACLCEISADNGKCSWRRVPQLPLAVNKFS